MEGAGRFDQGDPDGMAATNADDAVLTAATEERAEGKLVEHNMYWDTLGMMRQLGVLPQQTAVTG